MEFNFDIRKVLRTDSNGLVQILPHPSFRTPYINEIIDVMGRESSRAQGLRSTITSSMRFFASSDNKIYLKTSEQKVVGILKTGVRKLFYSNEIGKIIEMSPLCLLDFYVHEAFQRSGIGKELYEYMLCQERVTPSKIAIDRPSMKSLHFMRKHYNLSDYIPQNNNFVIFKQFFDDFDPPRSRRINESFPSDSYQRKTGMYLGRSINDRTVTEDRHRENYDNLPRVPTRQFEESKRNYAPVPPWGVSSNQYVKTTTSSQYGVHSMNK